MNKLTRITAAAGAVSVLGLLAACGGGGSTSGSADTTELQMAYTSQPATLDAHSSTAEATFDFMRGVYQGLVSLDMDQMPQPQLAESIDHNEDYSEYTFHLRDVTFHDGSALDSQDVIDSLERWFGLAPAGKFFENVELTAPDEKTVVMTSPEPFYAALTLLANNQNQFPAITTSEAVASAGTEGLTEFIGTGPYKYVEWKQDQFFHVEKFEDYVAPENDFTGGAAPAAPVYDDIYINIVPDASTRISGLQTGEYDIVSHVDFDQVEQAEGGGNARVEVFQKGLSGMTFNKKEGSPMASEDLRQAVLASLDMEAIMMGAFGSEEWFGVDAGLATPEQPAWHTDAGGENYNKPDPARAQQLMDAAGYDNEPIRITVTRDYPDHYNTAIVVEQQLKAAGFNVEMVVTDWPTVLDTQNNTMDWELGFSSWSPQSIPTRYTFMSQQSAGAIEDRAFFDAVHAVNFSSSEEDAQAAMAVMQEEFYRFLPMVKFGNKSGAVGISSEIAEYDIQPGAGSMGIYYNAKPAE
ncbi:ABC transporter substrate-binding protein [Brevibacterium samyangense]|uniref:ABC transporter substrate-binding protein n=1 Tax=Brevibacterium samyangense TaxID=366888 RepID=A0ABN2T804_9MICO